MSTQAQLLDTQVASGLPGVGSVPWGTHLCHFYRSETELRLPLVEFFRSGIENNERCLWITSAPLRADDARAALQQLIPDLPQLERNGQITIRDFDDWYTGSGSMEKSAVVQSWLDAEEEALALGYSGLRLTGNTTWLEPEGWDDFSEYETCCHAAFHTRRILALCSYSLDMCDADDVMDVLRNHEFALVCRNGEWEMVRNATQLLAAVNTTSPPEQTEHLVRFFREESYPAAAIAEYLARAAPGAAAAIGVQPHLDAIRHELQARGVDAEQVLLIDADALMLSTDDLQPVIEQLAQRVTAQGQRAHVYGELVDVLSRRGDKAGAIALEQAWNKLLGRYDFALWCGYEIGHFGADDAQACSAVCGCHGHVVVDDAERDNQVFAHAFVAELARRREYEADRARLLQVERQTNQRLALLQQVTSALSEALSPEDVAQVICTDLRLHLGASRAFLAMPDAEQKLRPVQYSGIPADIVERYLVVDAHAPIPAAAAYRTGLSVWLTDPTAIQSDYPGLPTEAQALACVPLKVRGRRLGVVAMGYATPQRFDSMQRALLEDTCNQAGLALERARLYAEAEQQRERAEQAARAKDQFIAMLGHELRNPLAAIHTAAELLGLSPIRPDMLARTQAILTRQSAHMSKLIDDLLDTSRIVLGKISLETRLVNFTEIVRQVVGDRREDIEKHGIRLHTTLGEQALWVTGDAVRLVQVVDNILANAIKFTPDAGAIEVSLGLNDAGQVTLSAQDTGVGIDPALLPHIFEPFQQAGQDLARSSGGLGLGLTLVKGIVDLHQGSVRVVSAGRDRGCTVTVELPAAEPHAGAVAKVDAAGARSWRVLLIEDNQDAAELLASLLRYEGHTVSIAHTGERAVEVAAELCPEVVLCDLGLPGQMDGYDVARALRAADQSQIQIMAALSGYAAPEDVEHARQAGFDRHITKPISHDTLRSLFTDLTCQPH